MDGGAAPVVTSALTMVGNPIVQATINRWKRGRQIARGSLGVYIPGRGDLMDFKSDPVNKQRLEEILQHEKWIREYLKPSVIDLKELESALRATKVLQKGNYSANLESAVMILGTTKPAVKLEGILLALQEGFLENFETESSNETERTEFNDSTDHIPWKLLHQAKCPVEPWLISTRLLDIWFAIHCPVIFPVKHSRIIAAYDTYRRIDGYQRMLLHVNGGQSEEFEGPRYHYQVAGEELLKIARSTLTSLIRGPTVDLPDESQRLAGIIGGIEILNALGSDCAKLVLSALDDVYRGISKDLKIACLSGSYFAITYCSIERAEQDHKEMEDGKHKLKVPGSDEFLIFSNATIINDNTKRFEEPLSSMTGQDVFRNPQNLEKVCHAVDHAMTVFEKKTVLEENTCRLYEVASNSFAQHISKSRKLTNEDFSSCTWGVLKFDGVCLELKWNKEFKFCVIDTLGTKISLNQIRLPMQEPTKVRFVNLFGHDVAIQTRHISIPARMGFKKVDFADKYCYLQTPGREFTGKTWPVGSVGVWKQTHSEITFESEGDGVLI